MIVKIQKAGGSFRGLTAYLTEQKERVAWTHSLNCANDDVPSIVHELYTTASQAEYLKAQAGVHAGGSVVDKPVKHISLNWHPDQQPTREEMIAAAEDFLNRMGWEEHQALLVAHNDKAHAHVHIELSRINPETGKVLNDAYERRRASDWALAYEREHGKVYCEDRLLNVEDRGRALSRRAWERLREFEREYQREEEARLDAENVVWFKRDETLDGHEWHLLKGRQRNEREEFMAQGKSFYRELRNDVYQAVREEMREDWANYYAAARTGLDRETLDTWKAAIIDLEKARFDEAKDHAFAELRSDRDDDYKLLLAHQKEERAELRLAQSEGRRSYESLKLTRYEPDAPPLLELKEASNQNAPPIEEIGTEEKPAPEPEKAGHDLVLGTKFGLDFGLGLVGGVATLVERLFDGFLDPRPVRKEPPHPEPDRDEQRQREAARLQRIEAAIEAAREERERQREDAYWQDRERRRR